MEYVKKAIERALSAGGWKINSPYYRSTDKVVELKYFYGNVAILIDEDGHHHRIRIEEITQNPDFWNALGKAEGWGKCTMYSFSTGKIYSEEEWLYNFHWFIDHLVTGKTPDEFFKELLK